MLRGAICTTALRKTTQITAMPAKPFPKPSALFRQRSRALSLQRTAGLPMKPYLLTLLIAAIAMLSDLVGKADRSRRKLYRAPFAADLARDIGRRAT